MESLRKCGEAITGIWRYHGPSNLEYTIETPPPGGGGAVCDKLKPMMLEKTNPMIKENLLYGMWVPDCK